MNLTPELQADFDRWLAMIDEDPYDSRDTIGIYDVLRAHFLIIDYFYTERDGEGVGGIGPKDLNRLHSAVYRQFVQFDNHEKWPDPLQKCATLVYGIVKDHPFHDANKRTAFLISLYFLEKLNRTPSVQQREFEDFLVDIADDNLDAYPRFKKIEDNHDDPEIVFIADELKRKSRPIDRRHYRITYHQLSKILNGYGFELCHPHGNFIDVVEVRRRRRYLGIAGPKEIHRQKLGQIGFPGWKRQVGRKDIGRARQLTGLTPEKGYDSQTFFKGADPLEILIDTYRGPLRRLSMK